MAKFYGPIGYAVSTETSPGVWEDKIAVRNYCGDVLQHVQNWQKGEGVNDDLTINNRISIVADPFAYENSGSIKYVKYLGSCWKVTGIDVQFPRLILTIGGVYNGPET